MTELTIDVPRLRKELEYVTAHRAQWKQGAWIQRTACGTVGCLAGNIVLNAGYRPVFATSKHISTKSVVAATAASYAVEQRVADVAADVLGLDNEQAAKLFFPENSLLELWTLASEFTGGEIQVPAEVLAEAENDDYVPNGYNLVARVSDEGYALRQRQREHRRRGAITELAELL